MEVNMIKVIKLIEEVIEDRDFNSIERRISKFYEEFGEVNEAYLNVTSALNVKNKTYDDLREEIADCVIVALDVLLTIIPDKHTYIYNVILDYEDIHPKKIRNLDGFLDNSFELIRIYSKTTSDLALVKKYFSHSDISSKTENLDNKRFLAAKQLANIVPYLFDMAYIRMPDKENLSLAEIAQDFENIVKLKILKWKKQIDKQKEISEKHYTQGN
jgi:hypothetical protein